MRNTIIKNTLIHVLLVPIYFFAQSEISTLPVEQLDTLLLFVGLIVIAPITSNFMYSYRGVKAREAVTLGDFTTFFSMLVIGVLFIILDILLVLMIGQVLIFRITLLLFWIAVLTFDFADRVNLE